MSKRLIYIAGPLNNYACDYLQNCHKMTVVAEEVRKAGFCVFNPSCDLTAGLIIGNLSYKDFFDNSQAILERSDAVFLVSGWGTSEGTKKEIAKATMLGIPIFEDLEEMKEYFEQEK